MLNLCEKGEKDTENEKNHLSGGFFDLFKPVQSNPDQHVGKEKGRTYRSPPRWVQQKRYVLLGKDTINGNLSSILIDTKKRKRIQKVRKTACRVVFLMCLSRFKAIRISA